MNDLPKPVVALIVVVVLALVGGIGWYFMGQSERAQAAAKPAPPPWMEQAPDGSFRPKGAATSSSGPGASGTGGPGMQPAGMPGGQR